MTRAGNGARHTSYNAAMGKRCWGEPLQPAEPLLTLESNAVLMTAAFASWGEGTPFHHGRVGDGFTLLPAGPCGAGGRAGWHAGGPGGGGAGRPGARHLAIWAWGQWVGGRVHKVPGTLADAAVSRAGAGRSAGRPA